MDPMKEDILLIDDFQPTAKGDLQTISGLLNLKESIYRRILTNPGEVVHRPLYGVGVRRFMNYPATVSNRQELANLVTMNIARESRIKKVIYARCDWNLDVAMIEIKVEVDEGTAEFQYEVVK